MEGARSESCLDLGDMLVRAPILIMWPKAFSVSVGLLAFSAVIALPIGVSGDLICSYL